MLTIRTHRQVADSLSIASFRACPRCHHSYSTRASNLGRQAQSQGQIRDAELRRQWLCQQWQTRLLR